MKVPLVKIFGIRLCINFTGVEKLFWSVWKWIFICVLAKMLRSVDLPIYFTIFRLMLIFDNGCTPVTLKIKWTLKICSKKIYNYSSCILQEKSRGFEKIYDVRSNLSAIYCRKTGFCDFYLFFLTLLIRSFLPVYMYLCESVRLYDTLFRKIHPVPILIKTSNVSEHIYFEF